MGWIDHFGLLAPIYDRLIGVKQPEHLFRHLGLPVNGSLLDAGGGTGRVSAAMVASIDRVYVVDLSSRMLSRAQRKKGLIAIRSESERLPFLDDCFERVLMVDALHHVYHHQETANELWRVLKPGGRLVIEEPNIDTLGVKLIAILEKIALMRSHFLSPRRIGDLFRRNAARIAIEVDGPFAWIIVEKIPESA